MTRYMLLILTGSALCISSAQATIFDLKLDMRVAIQTCAGGVKGGPKTKCRQVINAIGDKVNIPLSQLKIQSLDLSQPDQALALPVTAGTRTAYSFVPSQGELAGKTVYLVFDNVAQRAGTKDFGKMVIKMYRNVKDVDQEGAWTEVGNLNFGNLNMPFSVKPDGTFLTQDTEFLLGQKLINT